jgi:conjugative transfer pilus assembly protein TraH
MKTYRFCHRRAVGVSLGIVLALTPCLPSNAESLQDQAASMFSGMANTTAPQAFKGQTMNTYTGGSMFVRVPNKRYQLATASAPYLRIGGNCSGIDAHLGSFSHISGAEFKNMLSGITSAIPGILFQLAIKSVEPLLGDTMEYFNSIATMVNRASISSCEAAKQVVYDGMDLMGFSSTKRCEAFAMMNNKDAAQAREMCKTREGVAGQNEAAKADPDKKEMVPFSGNLVWEILKKMTHLDNADREIVMSIAGTTVIPPAYVDAPSEPRILMVKGLSTAAFLEGTDSGCSAGQINLIRCNDYTNCLTPAIQCTDFKPMRTRVAEVMASLADKIKSGTANVEDAERNFVNNVPLPVYRILAAGGVKNNSAISEALRNQFNDYIAIEFVHGLLSRMTGEATTIDMHSIKLGDYAKKQLGRHVEQARQFMTQLNADRQVAEQRAAAVTFIIQQVAQPERDMRASMPQQVRDLLAYSPLGG